MTYLTRLLCTQEEARTALARNDAFADVVPAPTLVGNEIEEEDLWELLLYTEEPPAPRTLQTLAAFSPANSQSLESGPLPQADWVTLSQAGTEPINIGRFYIHTDHYRDQQKSGQWPLTINAAQAFGTGHHATTSGCLAMMARLAKKRRFSNILDVGTGSGILLFAACYLWRDARFLGTDHDTVAIAVARTNAETNHRAKGCGAGQIHFVRAPGTRHAAIRAQQPYDLVFANILARPLVAITSQIAPLLAENGHLVLAGLLRKQIPLVLGAYRARGLRLAAPPTPGEWPTLLLRRQGISSIPVRPPQ